MSIQWVVRNTTDNPYLFQTVKGRVDIVEAARHYGLSPDRRGWCTCPFHGEKTPSFHLKDQRGHCFGCGWSGDVVDLVGGMLHIGPMEAVKELNGSFHLGIDLEAPVDVEAVVRAIAERRERERFKLWREGTIRVLTDYHRELHLIRLHEDSRDPDKGVSDRYAFAAREIDKIEYYLDLVCYGDEAEIKKNQRNFEKIFEKIKGTNLDEKN